jgi:mannose-6-phosphate isomerase
MSNTSDLSIVGTEDKVEIFAKVEQYLQALGIAFSSVDRERPWGGFFVIDEPKTSDFIATYFPDYDASQIGQFGAKLSPKILVVGPGMRLSWQYHDRRAELWRTVHGPVGFCRSLDDEQGEVRQLADGEIVQFAPSERHRLIGLEGWGIVAEIWQHTDPNLASDESDITRLSDDFGR